MSEASFVHVQQLGCARGTIPSHAAAGLSSQKGWEPLLYLTIKILAFKIQSKTFFF